MELLEQPADLFARFKNLQHGNWVGAFAGQARDDVEDVEVSEQQANGKGRFVSGTCTNAAGTRSYKLYIPASYTGEALPLIVMLHGCTQNPDDFAVGTEMNVVAEERHCFVVYPAQTKTANGSNCWNWFQPGDQRRDHGEPSIIADITRKIAREYKIDERRVYAAGLSAGGAMAAILGATYPELYAAVGIHSGLPIGVAHDTSSAFAAMKGGNGKVSARAASARSPAVLAHAIPVIVFHGDRDSTVHASNGDTALRQCVQAHAADDISVKVEQGRSRNGRSYTRAVHHDAQGKAIAEKWTVHGAGHAWAGGSGKGSYTDPQGPDAAREMVRFFYTHAHSSRPSAGDSPGSTRSR
jgi:poly(hydroxyalkanoate) depolymerase family esterase